ncbi:metabotropic glutamate receptor 5-like isoform X2 [Planococcus citri]|uniref:metabotropic glutamate receptor 5-like isoform X2 n=1 Tax=Planococcus citri TaxID=170843 RepID=UPI0031F801A1
MPDSGPHTNNYVVRDPNLLPNITLEIVVKDYGDFPQNGVKKIDSTLFEELCWFGNWITIKDGLSCPQNETSHLIGVIYSDDMEIEPKFQTLLQSFPLIPHISYSGPPKGILVNENLRLERSGKLRSFNAISSGSIFIIDIIFEMLLHYNWTYVALVYTSVGYQGIRYAKRFQDMAADNAICIAHIMDSESLWKIFAWRQNLWEVIPPYNTVQVIVCICDEKELMYLQHVLIGNGRKNNTYIVIVANGNGAGLPRYLYTTQNWNKDVVHMNYVIPKATTVKEFNDYYFSKTVENNQRNPWYKEFWEQHFACKFEPIKNETKCNGTMQRRNDAKLWLFQQYSEVANVMKSVYTLAHSLHDTLSNDNWKEYPNFWNMLRSYVNEVNFTLFGDEVSFTYDGLPRTETFEAYCFHEDFTPSKVGEFFKTGYRYFINENRGENAQSFLYHRRTLGVSGTLVMNESAALFPTNIKHSCSEPCPPGHATIKQNDTCCWKCDPCDSLEILNDTSMCTKCDHGYMSNENKTACVPILVRRSKWYDIDSLISTCFSLLCITLTIFTSGVFIKYRDTPAVKSTTRELCHLMFAGMVLANITPFISILSLNEITCAMIRIVPAISFTMIYASLLVKTNRIARLLAMSKKKFPNMNPKFMSLKSQITITFILIAIEVLICSIQLYFKQPEAVINYREENNTWFGSETCDFDEDILIETFVFVALLVLFCTKYAVKTRNVPENFNEAKYIGFAMYATVLTGMAFALVYFNSDKKMLAINLSVSISSSIVLIFLFAPKLYIILLKPQRNTKGNFVITTDIRSYQGNEKRSHSKQQHSIKMKEKGQKTNNPNVLKEQLKRSISTASSEISKVLETDGQETRSTSENESQNDKNMNIIEETYAQMIEKLKLCHMELNRLQKEVSKDE